MKLLLGDIWVDNQGRLRDSDGPIYQWLGTESDAAVSSEDFSRLLNVGRLDDQVFSTNQGLYTITCGDTKVTLKKGTEGIVLDANSPTVTPPSIPSRYPEEIAFAFMYEKYLKLFINTRALGFCSKDQGAMYDRFRGLFIPKDDKGSDYYGHYITIERESKFFDLNELDLSHNSLIMITFKNSKEVIYTDLTPGSDPDLGLIVEDRTITSSRLIKRLDIYHEDIHPIQL